MRCRTYSGRVVHDRVVVVRHAEVVIFFFDEVHAEAPVAQAVVVDRQVVVAVVALVLVQHAQHVTNLVQYRALLQIYGS